MNLKAHFFSFAVVWLACAPARAATFSINKVFTSQNSGGVEVDYAPVVGDRYRIAVTFTQTGVASQPYNVVFNLAGQTQTFTVTDLSEGQKTAFEVFELALDDDVPYSVTIDPGNPSGDTKGSHFKPTPPNKPLEFFDTATVDGVQTVIYTISSAGPYELKYMSAIPATDGWQKYISGSCSVLLTKGGKLGHPSKVGSAIIDGPSSLPINFFDGKNLTATQVTFTQQFKLELSSQRVNPDKLRLVSWKDIDALQGINVFKHFTQPENVVQSDDPVITKFVLGALGFNYRLHFTPYDAARTLFKAVLKHCQYTFPAPGQPDLRAQTAVDMVKTGLGDCGSYSILLAAVYRNIGIPARASCGAWVGKDIGHCWTEMWFPTAGWIVSDGTSGDAVSPNGDFACYFGYVPDLNIRYAQCRGNQFAYKGCSDDWLQGPMFTPVITPGVNLNVSGSTVITTNVAAPVFYSLKKGMPPHFGLHPWNIWIHKLAPKSKHPSNGSK